jgi:hypothetical protein
MKRLIASLSFYTPLTRIDIHRLLDQERQAMLKKAEELNALTLQRKEEARLAGQRMLQEAAETNAAAIEMKKRQKLEMEEENLRIALYIAERDRKEQVRTVFLLAQFPPAARVRMHARMCEHTSTVSAASWVAFFAFRLACLPSLPCQSVSPATQTCVAWVILVSYDDADVYWHLKFSDPAPLLGLCMSLTVRDPCLDCMICTICSHHLYCIMQEAHPTAALSLRAEIRHVRVQERLDALEADAKHQAEETARMRAQQVTACN